MTVAIGGVNYRLVNLNKLLVAIGERGLSNWATDIDHFQSISSKNEENVSIHEQRDASRSCVKIF